MAGLLEHYGSMTNDRPERVIVHPFAGVDDQIAAFCSVFTDLQKDFDSRLSLSTALVLSRTASSVDMIGACVHLQPFYIVLLFPRSTQSSFETSGYGRI